MCSVVKINVLMCFQFLKSWCSGVHVHSLMLGDNVVQDTENGFFLNINTQIEMACQKIQADEKLKGYLLDLKIFPID